MAYFQQSRNYVLKGKYFWYKRYHGSTIVKVEDNDASANHIRKCNLTVLTAAEAQSILNSEEDNYNAAGKYILGGNPIQASKPTLE